MLQGEFVPQLQAEENRAGGSVDTSLYLRYFYYGGGVFGLVLCVLLNILAQTSFVLADWWLAYWCVVLSCQAPAWCIDCSLNNYSVPSNIR